MSAKSLKLFNKVKSSIKTSYKKLSLDGYMLVVLMKLKLGVFNKDLAVRFDISTSRILKIFRIIVPLIPAHMTNLIVRKIMGQLGGICPEVFKKNLKILCAS